MAELGGSLAAIAAEKLIEKAVTVEGHPRVTSKVAAWVRRVSETEFTAFSVNCSHLGCPVRWLPKAKLFMCPCHGGVYNKDGNVVAGPPPKSLNRYEVRIENGEVQLMTQAIFLA